ncbi:hypothetical protein SAMN05421820_103514 [Pedobacter steynii]|uniref:Uncharacterized protein n=1 Tax=Pedobacter steynii TaxID=430522 RepID=A0A1G9SB87_9SPHI|nr:hypothetical protein SAMN05421820_103514 [Pedobacter steynii]
MVIEDQFKTINRLQNQVLKLAPHPEQWDEEYLDKVKVDFIQKEYRKQKRSGNLRSLLLFCLNLNKIL